MAEQAGMSVTFCGLQWGSLEHGQAVDTAVSDTKSFTGGQGMRWEEWAGSHRADFIAFGISFGVGLLGHCDKVPQSGGPCPDCSTSHCPFPIVRPRVALSFAG